MKNFIYVANRNILHNELFGYSTDEVHGIKKLMVGPGWYNICTIIAQTKY